MYHRFRTLVKQKGPKVIQKFHAQFIFLLINVKMPTIVDILTFMGKINSILDLKKPDTNAKFLDIFILISI